ncbi:hypothetical protein ACFQ5B_13810 [Laceyella putida]|uniref:Uncharacterized protein n=1 Tax=Laceyella putida TaxID=110101 RepID=A0ABW2RPE4_9BACL
MNIVCYDPEPTWIKVKANYIQVPFGHGLAESIPETDVIVTTVWDQMIDCYLIQKAPVIHFEHGDIYIFEFENYNNDTQELWKQRWSVPIPILAVSSGLAAQIEKTLNENTSDKNICFMNICSDYTATAYRCKLLTKLYGHSSK